MVAKTKSACRRYRVTARPRRSPSMDCPTHHHTFQKLRREAMTNRWSNSHENAPHRMREQPNFWDSISSFRLHTIRFCRGFSQQYLDRATPHDFCISAKLFEERWGILSENMRKLGRNPQQGSGSETQTSNFAVYLLRHAISLRDEEN